jgi:tripartite-type tricarboxylate transporter receptor subunit TctC
MKLGGVGPGTTLSVPPRVLKASLGLPIQLIEGYLGANEVKLAAEQGELDGGCWNWGSIKVMWGKGIDAGDVSVIVQANPERDPDLANVPNAIELAKTDKARALLSAGIHAQTSMFRAYSIPPKVPADRIQILQTAFMSTMADPDFLKDAHQAQIDIAPLSGPEVKKIVSDLSKLDDAMLAELKKILLD